MLSIERRAPVPLCVHDTSLVVFNMQLRFASIIILDKKDDKQSVSIRFKPLELPVLGKADQDQALALC